MINMDICLQIENALVQNFANGPMAVWSRAYIIKASLLVAILLLVLNVYYNILPTSRFHEIPTVSSLLHSRWVSIWAHSENVICCITLLLPGLTEPATKA